jgi:hypothetical protein
MCGYRGRPEVILPIFRVTLSEIFSGPACSMAHIEIEQTLALVALFLVLLSRFDDLFEDLHVKPFPFSLRKHFLSSVQARGHLALVAAFVAGMLVHADLRLPL